MGFGMMMRQRAVFGSARAMLWAGLKHEDRSLTIERVGDLISDYLRDEEVPEGTNTIDAILSLALAAAVEQGALGRYKEPDPIKQEGEEGEEGQNEADVVDAEARRVTDPNVSDGADPSSTSHS